MTTMTRLRRPEAAQESVEMSESKDPLQRMLALLSIIPKYPHRVATGVLLERLRDKGFRIDQRSLQRDLNKLSLQFPIACCDRVRPYRWGYTESAQLSLPAIDIPEALALCLAETYLKSVLPQGVMYQLTSRFDQAREVLGTLSHNELKNWPQRVRALPNGKALIPAELAHDIWATVSTALVEQRQLQVGYLSRSKGAQKQFRLHPLGLVTRHSISYLIATVNDYDDPRQFALHRIKQAELLGDAARPNDQFNIDDYIASGAFSFRQSTEMVELVADVHPQIAWLLSETPISEEQTLEPLPDSDWQRLRARVPMDQETLWWVFGLNENIRVYGPGVWVDEIRVGVEKMAGFYIS